MATVINNPAHSDTSGNTMGLIIALLVVIAFFFLFFSYVLPYIEKGMSGGIQVNIPKDVNVKVQQSK